MKQATTTAKEAGFANSSVTLVRVQRSQMVLSTDGSITSVLFGPAPGRTSSAATIILQGPIGHVGRNRLSRTKVLNLSVRRGRASSQNASNLLTLRGSVLVTDGATANVYLLCNGQAKAISAGSSSESFIAEIACGEGEIYDLCIVMTARRTSSGQTARIELDSIN